jgi:hypothetical protein
MKRFVSVLLATCLAAFVGCDSDGFTAPPSALNGTWFAPNEVPGSSNVWTLTVSGNTIAGTGTWSGEACCGGTIAMSGTVVNGAIHMDVTVTTTAPTQRPAVHERFDGAMVSADILQGTVTFDDATTGLLRMIRR